MKPATLIRTVFAIWITAVCFTASARASAYIDAMFATPTVQELDSVYENSQYQPQCIAFALGDVAGEFQGGRIYHITYTSDGFAQTGMLGMPEGAGPYPLAVLNHAGFSGLSGFDTHDAQSFVEHGYVAALATYRGEGGQAGPAQGPMDVLGDEMHDILNLMECAAALPAVDPDRIVMMGVSHGGGLTLSALLRTRRVRAAATMAAPLNLTAPIIRDLAANWVKSPSGVEAALSLLVNKHGIAKLRQVFGIRDKDAGVTPERRFELLRRSPALFADRLTVPLLMYVGSGDPVSYHGDCRDVAASLLARGIESKCTVFDGQGHAIKREDADAAREVIFEFFEEYLKE